MAALFTVTPSLSKGLSFTHYVAGMAEPHATPKFVPCGMKNSKILYFSHNSGGLNDRSYHCHAEPCQGSISLSLHLVQAWPRPDGDREPKGALQLYGGKLLGIVFSCICFLQLRLLRCSEDCIIARQCNGIINQSKTKAKYVTINAHFPVFSYYPVTLRLCGQP